MSTEDRKDRTEDRKDRSEDRSANARGPQHVTHFDDCGCLTARYEARIAALEAELAEAQRDVATERQRANDWMARVDSADHEGCAWMCHANALRDALEEVLPGLSFSQQSRFRSLLDDSPAASLAALEAELAEARERADAYAVAVDESDHRGMAWMAHANALRDALEKVRPACDVPLGGCEPKRPCPSCRESASIEAALAAHPAASLAALKAEVGMRVVSECAMTMRSKCDCSHCDENAPGWEGRDIVERALAAQEVKP